MRRLKATNVSLGNYSVESVAELKLTCACGTSLLGSGLPIHRFSLVNSNSGLGHGTSVDNIGKFNGVLNEEYGYVVSHNIPIPLFCIELNCKTTHITYGICRTTGSENRGKTDKNRSCAAGVVENACRGELGDSFVELEVAVGAGTSGVDNTLWYPLMVN